MIVNVDIDKVEQFIKSDDFMQYLLKGTEQDIGVCSFILQTLFEKIDEVRKELEEKNIRI